MTIRLLSIALGGGLGAVGRYVVGAWVTRFVPTAGFPFGTLVVNVAGSFALGLLLAASSSGRIALEDNTHALVAVGFLGAFTTFSTFSFETLEALRNGHSHVAFLNIAMSLLLALAACWIGWSLGSRT